MARRRKKRRAQKATVAVRKHPVILVNKRFLELLDSKKSVVYFIRGNKAVAYKYVGRPSRILYIGRTQRKGARPFESLRRHAPELLDRRGVKSPEVVYIEAPPRQRVDIAKKLEKMCLHEFRGWFGEIPKANTQGARRLELTDEGRYFKRDRVLQILKQLSS